jgi:creatinine amidohydrolase
MHACEGETSLWLAMEPAQVRTDRIPAPGNTPPAPAGYSRFYSFWERAAPTGVRGDARAATAEKGKAILNAVTTAIAAAMDNPVLWTQPDPVWDPARSAPE